MFLTILLSILMSFAPLQSNVCNDCDAQSENIEIKQHKNFGIDTNHIWLGMNEIISQQFISSFLDEIYTNSNNVFNTGVSDTDFTNGTPLIVDTYDPNTGLDLDVRIGGYIEQGQVFTTYNPISRIKVEFSATTLPNQDIGYPFKFDFYFYLSSGTNPLTYDTYYLAHADCYAIPQSGLLVNYAVTGYCKYFSPNQEVYASGQLIRYSKTTLNGFFPSSFVDSNVQQQLDSEYNRGYQKGYQSGYQSGQQIANQTQYNNGKTDGYQLGYADGLSEAQQQDTLALQIFSGCVEVGLLPINVMLRMFEYEIFGINVAGFVSALLTIAIVIIVIRVVTGKKDD